MHKNVSPISENFRHMGRTSLSSPEELLAGNKESQFSLFYTIRLFFNLEPLIQTSYI